MRVSEFRVTLNQVAEFWEAATVSCPETPAAIAAMPHRVAAIAADSARLAAMRAALTELAARYGPERFVHDVLSLMNDQATGTPKDIIVETSYAPPNRADTSRDRNIVVVGFPKSGTTWTTRLLAEAIECPVKGFWGSRHAELATEGLERESACAVYKAHQSYADISNYKIGKIERIFYVVRDPRDVACSGAHYFSPVEYNSYYKTEVDKYEAMVRTIIHGSVYSQCRRSWGEHVDDYLGKEVFFVNYESLLDRPLEVLQEMMSYIGLSKTKGSLVAAIERQSFTTVKKRALEANDRRNFKFLRKGGSRAYLEELSTEQCDRIVEAFRSQMARFGFLQGNSQATHGSSALRGP